MSPFFVELFPEKRLTNFVFAYNINSVRSIGRTPYHKAWIRTSNRQPSSQRAARTVRGRRGGPGEDPLGAADPTRLSQTVMPVGSAGCARYSAYKCRMLSRLACSRRGSKVSPLARSQPAAHDGSALLRNWSGTAGVCAFVSFWGQGRFCLTGQGQADSHGKGGSDQGLPLQRVNVAFRVPGLFQMFLCLCV